MKAQRGVVTTAALLLGILVFACAPAPAQPAKPAEPVKAAEPAKPAAPAPAAPAPQKPAAPAPAQKPAAPAAAPAPAKAAQMEKVKIGLTPIFEYMALYAAKELGFFAQEGIDAEFVQFRGGGEVTTAMLGKSIDVAATTTDRALILAEKGQQTKNLVSTINRVQQVLIVRSDLNVAYGDLKALKGLKLGMTSAGSGTDLYMRYYLKSAGLDPEKDVSIIAVGPPGTMVSALQSRQVDGVNAIEPAATQAVQQMKIAKPVLDAAKDGPGLIKTMPFLSLGATAEWIDAHKETAKKVIRAQVRGNNELRADPRKGIEVAKKYFENVDPSLLETILKTQAPYYVGEITEEEMKSALALNRELGLITKDVPYEAVTVSKELRDLWK